MGCTKDQHANLILHEYLMPSPSFCFDCNIEPEKLLREAGAPIAGLSAKHRKMLLEQLWPPKVKKLLRGSGDYDERERVAKETWLIDKVTNAALIVQRDSLVEMRLHTHHGESELLARRMCRDFRAASHWAALFETGLIGVGGTESPRVSRRLHSLGGWGLWDDQAGTHQRFESAPCGWCSIRRVSTIHSGERFAQ